jgi:hypothetical protein
MDLSIHLGREVCEMYGKYFDLQEGKLNSLIDKLSLSNTEIKIISSVTNKLSHAKQKDKQADFSNDEEMKRYIAHIHKNNPTIFEDLVKGVPDHLPHAELTTSGEAISVESMLNHSLKDVNMHNVQIDVMTEDQIDVIIQGLDGALKMHSADLNEHMMKINENYDNRSQMTENSRKVVQETGSLLESINRKMVR